MRADTVIRPGDADHVRGPAPYASGALGPPTATTAPPLAASSGAMLSQYSIEPLAPGGRASATTIEVSKDVPPAGENFSTGGV